MEVFQDEGKSDFASVLGLVLMLLSVQMFGNQCLMNSPADRNIWLALIENGLGLPKALKHHLLEE